MYYLCILGESYESLGFHERERIREDLRVRLETHGIRFLEYCWVWDEDDRCLLVAGTYECMEDARQWIQTLRTMGFNITVRTSLPGKDPEKPGIRRGWGAGEKDR
jgi:hypothetical protein